MQFVVKAGVHPVENLPISAQTEQEVQEIVLSSGGKSVPAQAERPNGKTTVHWIVDKLAPGEEKVYDVKLGTSERAAGVEVSDIGDGKLEIKLSGALLTRYHYGQQWPRPFLFPVIGPENTPVTRSFPMIPDIPDEMRDHPHHRSIWVAYGEVNGTDNWSEEEGHGTQVDAGHSFSAGPVLGRITATNDWLSNAGQKQMEDTRTFTFYALPGSERIIDVEVVFKATVGDVLLGGTKEGGIISVRVPTSMDGDKGGTIENAFGGKTERECWGKPAQWTDYYGPVGGKTVGIAVFDHPVSFRHPTRWHVRDYGLFTANPFAIGDYEPERGESGDHTLKNGESLTFRYRLYLHKGDTESADVRNRYLGYVYPPKIEVKE